MNGRRTSGVRSEDRYWTLCQLLLEDLTLVSLSLRRPFCFGGSKTRPKMAAAPVGRSHRSRELRQMCVRARRFSEGPADKPRLIPSPVLHLRSPEGAKVQKRDTTRR